MAAAPRHISKYTSQYQSILPHTSILLLQCSLPAVFYSAEKQKGLLAPARDVVRSFEAGGWIVLHAFSNGGSTIACHLATQLKNDGNWAGFDRVVLDCCPSFPTIEGAVDAISFSLPKNPVLHAAGKVLLRVVIFTYLVLFVRLAGGEDGVRRIRRVLNSPEIFNVDAERMYVYSVQDALVQDWAVEMHAKDAKDRGYQVRQEKFEVGAHCALGVGDGGERYWKAVAGFMGESQ